jgi:DNA primase
LLLKDAQSDPVKRATLISDVVRSIAVIPDGITRTVYIRECSKILDADERVLYAEIRKIRRKRAEQKFKQVENYPSFIDDKPDVKQEKNPPDHTCHVEKDIIRLLLNYGNREEINVLNDKKQEIIVSVAKYIIHVIEDDMLEFSHPVYKTIFEEIKNQVKTDGLVDDSYFIKHSDNTIANTSADLLTILYKPSKIWQKHEVYIESEEMKLKSDVPKIVDAFKNQKVLAMIKETQQQLKNAQDNNDQANIILLQERFIVLNNLKKDLSKNLGDRIII